MLHKQPITQFRSDVAKKILKNHIEGFIPHLDHMCVTISCPQDNRILSIDDDNNRNLLMLSPIEKVENHYYNQTDFSKYDQGLSSKLYQQFAFYPWSDGTFGAKKHEIDRYKEEIYGLYAGHFVSVKFDENYYLIFGIASHCKDPMMKTIFANNIPKLAEAGLAFYSYLKPYFAEHTDIILPELKANLIKPSVKTLQDTLSSKALPTSQRYSHLQLVK